MYHRREVLSNVSVKRGIGRHVFPGSKSITDFCGLDLHLMILQHPIQHGLNLVIPEVSVVGPGAFGIGQLRAQVKQPVPGFQVH